MKIEDMTRGQLCAAIRKADAAHALLIDEMIAAGRGHETPDITRTKTDDLSVRFTTAFDRCSELYAERKRRIDYHGTEHRIIRPA